MFEYQPIPLDIPGIKLVLHFLSSFQKSPKTVNCRANKLPKLILRVYYTLAVWRSKCRFAVTFVIKGRLTVKKLSRG